MECVVVEERWSVSVGWPLERDLQTDKVHRSLVLSLPHTYTHTHTAAAPPFLNLTCLPVYLSHFTSLSCHTNTSVPTPFLSFPVSLPACPRPLVPLPPISLTFLLTASPSFLPEWLWSQELAESIDWCRHKVTCWKCCVETKRLTQKTWLNKRFSFIISLIIYWNRKYVASESSRVLYLYYSFGVIRESC